VSLRKINFSCNSPAALELAAERKELSTTALTSLSMLVDDFPGWFHSRPRHLGPLSWNVRTIRRPPGELKAFTDTNRHSFDLLVARTIALSPFLNLFILRGHSQRLVGGAALIALALTGLTSSYHADLSGRWGQLRNLFVTSQSRRVQHSTEEVHADRGFDAIFGIRARAFEPHSDDEVQRASGVGRRGSAPRERTRCHLAHRRASALRGPGGSVPTRSFSAQRSDQSNSTSVTASAVIITTRLSSGIQSLKPVNEPRFSTATSTGPGGA